MNIIITILKFMFGCFVLLIGLAFMFCPQLVRYCKRLEDEERRERLYQEVLGARDVRG